VQKYLPICSSKGLAGVFALGFARAIKPKFVQVRFHRSSASRLDWLAKRTGAQVFSGVTRRGVSGGKKRAKSRLALAGFELNESKN
jgi:hypothetical protein